MSDERTFAVTLVRAGSGSGLPTFEVAAYRYTAEWLPAVGEIIRITKAVVAEGETPVELVAYVTRVSPASDTPIAVMEAKGEAVAPADDYIVAA